MALKRIDDNNVSYSEEKVSTGKGDSLINRKEKKILTTFSIEPSFKAELENLFSDMGLGWAGGVRFALKEFIKNHGN